MRKTLFECLLEQENRAINTVVELRVVPRVGGYSVYFKGRSAMFQFFEWTGFMPCFQGVTDALLELQRRPQ
jgi:hypothetical protein